MGVATSGISISHRVAIRLLATCRAHDEALKWIGPDLHRLALSVPNTSGDGSDFATPPRFPTAFADPATWLTSSVPSRDTPAFRHGEG